MSYPTDDRTPRSEAVAPSVRTSFAPITGPTPSATSRPRIRAIEALKRFPQTAPSIPNPSSSRVAPSHPGLNPTSLPPMPASSMPPLKIRIPAKSSRIAPSPHGLDSMSLPPMPASSIPPIKIRIPAPAPPRPRALDVLQRLSSNPRPIAPQPESTTSVPRTHTSPSRRPSKKRRVQLSHQEVIELFGSDEEVPVDVEMFNAEEEEESDPIVLDAPDYVYNTKDHRCTDNDPDVWVISREEFHTQQVDRDRELAANLKNDLSTFVSLLYFCFLFLFLKAFSFQGHLRRRHGILAPISNRPVRDRDFRRLHPPPGPVSKHPWH